MTNTRVRRWRRTAVALVLAAPVVSVVPASSVSAGWWTTNKVCAGTANPRCVRFFYDYDAMRMFVKGSIKDSAQDHANYDVQVTDVGFRWRTVRVGAADSDGWHTFSDEGQTRVFGCFDFHYLSIRAGIDIDFYATFRWRGHSTGSQTLTGRTTKTCGPGRPA